MNWRLSRGSGPWGFLIDPSKLEDAAYSMAPAFDTGTSLGSLIRDADLGRFMKPAKLAEFITRGRHRYGWVSGGDGTAGHVALCGQFNKVYRVAGAAIGNTIRLSDSRIEQIMQWCTGFDFPILFTPSRAEFVAAQLRTQRGVARSRWRLGSEMEAWIEYVDEPARLILAWQAPDPEKDRLRWAVGELSRTTGVATFRYYYGDELTRLNSGRRQDELPASGFRGYPAFDVRNTPSGVFSDGVLESFLRRVPPRSRTDFPRYLEHFRVRSSNGLAPFALLAVTETKLPSDGFSLIDPLDPAADRRDFVFEVAGHRHYPDSRAGLTEGQAVRLARDPTNAHDPHAVRVEADGRLIGFVNRLQAPTVGRWLDARAVSASLLRLNGTPDQPRAFVFLRVRPLEGRRAA